MKKKILVGVLVLLLIAIALAGCLETENSEKDDNNVEINTLLNKNPYIIYNSAWETGSLTVGIFKDQTICFLYSGIDRYKNTTQDLNNLEIEHLLNLTGLYTSNQSKQNLDLYSSGIRIIDDINYIKLIDKLNQSNYSNLKNNYPGNETYDSEGYEILFKVFDETIKEIYIYDDGFHYEEEITNLIPLLRFLDELICNYWEGYS